MIPRNPFTIGNTEKIDGEATFLSLFNAKAIEYIKPDYIHKVVFFRSTPGAGKSSAFRLFTPNVLRELVGNNNPNYGDTQNFLKDLSVIDEEKIHLLGVQLSCAGNYTVIDDLYENSKRSQIFFALINLRIIRAALKNFLLMNKLKLDSLNRITFGDIAPDVASCIRINWSGADVYNWAIEEENKICRALDNISDPESISFGLSSLSFLSLISAKNLLLDGKKCIDHTLLLIDDLQLLTSYQRKELREEILKQKHTIGIWVAERISALKYDKILGSTGSEPRDYIELVLEKDIFKSSFKGKQSFLNDIADRRVRISKFSETIGSFAACLDESLPDNKLIGTKISNAIQSLESFIFDGGVNTSIYNYYNENYAKDYNGAIFLRAIKILIDKSLANVQTSLFSKKQVSENDVIPNGTRKTIFDDSTIMASAELYLCIENKIPYYYGVKKLNTLATFNIEQYLEIAGAIFERKIAESFTASKKRKSKVSAVEQETIIKSYAKKKWEMIDAQFRNSNDVYNLLNNIIAIGVDSREKALASYSGGAYTGIGIREDHLDELLRNMNCVAVSTALANAVSLNYLIVQEVKQGKPDDKWKVFYLNRWICALFGLPLQYGGWKPISQSKCGNLISKTPSLNVVTLEDYANV